MNPFLKKVVAYLFADQGLKMPRGFKLPKHFELVESGTVIDWTHVTKFLRTLTPAELEDFCIGDEKDQQRLAIEGGKTGEYAHRALDTLFMVIVI